MTRGKVLLYAVLVTILAASILYIGIAESNAWRYVQRDVIVIQPVINDDNFLFSQQALANWSSDFDGIIVGEQLQLRWFEFSNRVTAAMVSVVDHRYDEIMFARFLSGNMWRDGEESRVVLNETLAWELFGAFDVAGLNVNVDGISFSIAGVVADIVGYNNTGLAWLQNHTEYVGIVYLRPNDHNPVSVRRYVEDFIRTAERSIHSYIVTDINAYVRTFGLRRMILKLFFVAIAAIVVAQWIIEYFSMHNRKMIKIICIILITTGLFFAFIRSADYYGISLFGVGYARMLLNIGLLAPRQYLPGNLLALVSLNSNVNIAFLVGVIAGVVLCVFCQHNGSHVINAESSSQVSPAEA